MTSLLRRALRQQQCLTVCGSRRQAFLTAAIRAVLSSLRRVCGLCVWYLFSEGCMCGIGVVELDIVLCLFILGCQKEIPETVAFSRTRYTVVLMSVYMCVLYYLELF